mgnify:CR=1 FL=1
MERGREAARRATAWCGAAASRTSSGRWRGSTSSCRSCIFIIFVLLFGAFQSVGDALLIMLNLPFALIGGTLALYLLADELQHLGGGRLHRGLRRERPQRRGPGVVDPPGARQEGLPLREAIARGCEIRFRPIVVSAIVAVIGFLPAALSHGIGAEIQRPLARVVIGGLDLVHGAHAARAAGDLRAAERARGRRRAAGRSHRSRARVISRSESGRRFLTLLLLVPLVWLTPLRVREPAGPDLDRRLLRRCGLRRRRAAGALTRAGARRHDAVAVSATRSSSRCSSCSTSKPRRSSCGPALPAARRPSPSAVRHHTAAGRRLGAVDSRKVRRGRPSVLDR